MALTLLAAIALAPAMGQAQDMRAEIEALKKGQDAMAKDLAEIKKMLEGMQPKKPKPFEPMDISIKGIALPRRC